MQNIKKLDLGFYDSYVGEYDDYNPRYVKNKKGSMEILYTIAESTPYSIDAEIISAKINMDIETCKATLQALLKIEAISMKNDRYKINFPAFLERDMDIIGEFNLVAGKEMGDIVMSLQVKIDELLSRLSCYKDNSIEVLRYHAIACGTFDGEGIDYLSKKGIFTTSKDQPGGRDYLIIGYEDSDKTLECSEKLLCSCNNYCSKNMEFCSFGDSNGYRKDMLRFFKRVQSNLEASTEHEKLNLAYIKLNENMNMEIAQKCEQLILKVINEKVFYCDLNLDQRGVVDFLIELGYLSCTAEDERISCLVPVFSKEDSSIINEISELITLNIYDYVNNTINNLGVTLPGLTSVQHMVDFKDIANELWHLIFGAANEYLVQKGFFANPVYKAGEGRYLQCIYIK